MAEITLTDAWSLVGSGAMCVQAMVGRIYLALGSSAPPAGARGLIPDGVQNLYPAAGASIWARAQTTEGAVMVWTPCAAPGGGSSGGGGAASFADLPDRLLPRQVPAGGVAGQFLHYDGDWAIPPGPSGGAVGQFWGWDGAFRNPPTVSLDGSINPIDAPYGAAGDFNFVTWSGTADNAAIQAAMNAAAAQGKVLHITRTHYLAFQNVTGGGAGSIRFPEGLVMVCNPGCGFAFQHLYVPVFWKQGGGRLTLRDVSFYFFGTIPTDATPYSKWGSVGVAYWTDYQAQRYGSVNTSNPGDMLSIPGVDLTGTPMVICGGELDIDGTQFRALVADSGNASDCRKYFPNAIALYDANDGTLCSGRIGNTVLDGVHMGIFGSGWHNLHIDGVRSYRYGGGDINSGWGYNPSPPHGLYHTFTKKRGTVYVSNFVDYGINRCETTGGFETIKMVGAARTVIRGGYSLRPHGAISMICEDADIEYAGVMDASLVTAGQNGGAPFRALTNTVAGVPVKNGGRVKLRYRVVGSPAKMIEITTGDRLTIELDLSVDSVSSMSLVNANNGGNPPVTGCTIKADIRSDAAGDISALGSFFGAAVGNRIEVTSRDLTNLSTGANSKLRLIEQDRVNGANNTILFTDLNDGRSLETFAAGIARIRGLTKVVQQTAAAGASITIANFIPAGARNINVVPVVKTALGATNGTNGFTVGVTGDAARFGTFSGTGVNTGVGADGTAYTARPQTSAAPWQYDVNTNLLLTPTGGNFDGTGVIQVTLCYDLASQSSYAY